MYTCINSKTVKWRGGETFAIVLRSKHIIHTQHFVWPAQVWFDSQLVYEHCTLRGMHTALLYCRRPLPYIQNAMEAGPKNKLGSEY